jgi:hypothetical protein
LKELVVGKTAMINTTTESVPTRTASAKIAVKTSSEMELFHLFYVAGISGEKGVDTELHEVLLISEESNRSVQLRDSVFVKQP